MPAISLISVPLYQAGDVYNHLVDNRPLTGLIARDAAINNQVDINTTILEGSIGSAGTLNNRLNQSLNEDGSLKESAIDAALHNIAMHVDGAVIVDGNPISYVRMLSDERAKLTDVASGATNLKVLVDVVNLPISNAPSNISFISSSEVEYYQDIFHIKASDSIQWQVESDGSVTANTTFPASIRHNHFYDYAPAHVTPSSPDYKHYKVTSVGTPYKEQTLRVYINGIRLSQLAATYYPTNFSSTIIWKSNYFTEGTATGGVVTDGTFTLASAITASDNIKIDFDMLYS